jgi:hypothetical protein
MRFVTTLLGVAAALVMLGVSGAMNYLFLSSLGKTPVEAQVLGAASAAADALKALLPFFIFWGWRSGRYSVAIPGMLVWLFFSGFSLLSAIGFAADNRGVFSHGRASVNADYERAAAELREVEGRLAIVPKHRPSGIVTEEIERQKQDWRWASTKACTNATLPDSRAYCDAHFVLRAEHAAGVEAQRLAGQIETLKQQIEKLRHAGAGQDADPQVSLLARLFGHAHDRIRLGLILIAALLVEIGSSLGLFLATSHGELFARRKQENAIVHEQHDVSPQPTGDSRSKSKAKPFAKKQKIGAVEDFCLECLIAAPEGSLTLTQLFEAYRAWCNKVGYITTGKQEFDRSFQELSKQVGLHNERGQYYRVGLKDGAT